MFQRDLITLSLAIAMVSLVVACSVSKLDPKVAEKMFEKYLKIDMPSNFKIVKHKTGGVVDAHEKVIIEFEKAEYDRIVSQLDMSEWAPMAINSETEELYEKFFTINDREYVVITLVNHKNMIGYLWSFD